MPMSSPAATSSAQGFETGVFTSIDQTKIPYIHWRQITERKDGRKTAVVFIHGLYSTAEAYNRVLPDLSAMNLSSSSVYAISIRQSGKITMEEKEKKKWKSDKDKDDKEKKEDEPKANLDKNTLTASVADLNMFVRVISVRESIDMSCFVVIGEGTGAVLAATWVHDFAPRIRGLVLVSPALGTGGWPANALKLPGFLTKNGVKSTCPVEYLTDDERLKPIFAQGNTAERTVTTMFISDYQACVQRLVKDSGSIFAPTMVIAGYGDKYIDINNVRTFYSNLGSVRKEYHSFGANLLEPLFSMQRSTIAIRIGEFIDHLYVLPPFEPDYVRMDRWSTSADQYRQLKADIKKYDTKWFNIKKNLMHKAGPKLSPAISLVLKNGILNDETEQYITDNKIRTVNPVGMWLDRKFLRNDVISAWRKNKNDFYSIVETLAKNLIDQERPINLLDIAAGNGRHTLDTISRLKRYDSLTLRDPNALNVQAGVNAIRRRNQMFHAEFKQSNPFEPSSYHFDNKFTVVLAGWIFETNPRNDDILIALRSIANCMDSGGYLVYTNHPWTPNPGKFAAIFDTNEFNVRNRSQAELDALVTMSGFEKTDQLCDVNGIFSVSVAVKI